VEDQDVGQQAVKTAMAAAAEAVENLGLEKF
jgi:hypothetical protein